MMDKICVFAGTTEGRELVSFLTAQRNAAVMACVATEYGETLLPPADNLTISAKRLTGEEMAQLFADFYFDLVVDATHPYASAVTENIVAACRKTNTPYHRLARGNTASPEDAAFVSDAGEAAAYLSTEEGNILLTTGSKEMQRYAAVRDFKDRIYARILPMQESLLLCEKAGLPPSHILAMQGPFSREMNVAMLRAVSARFMVTKESGSAGGFAEKTAAAREAGAKLVVIGRPPQREGMDFQETVAMLCARFGWRPRPQVKVVGIGPGSRRIMTAEALEAIAQADCVIGARRMLEATAEGDQSRFEAIDPEKIANYIAAHPQFQHFAVVMSGDTGFFSGTKKLLPLLKNCDIEVLPGISSLSYLCSKLGKDYSKVRPVSLHGRRGNIVREVQTHRQVFALVGGENGAGLLCRELTEHNLGGVQVWIGERLSYEDEKITSDTAAEWSRKTFCALSAVLIENGDARELTAAGLPDVYFLRNEKQDKTVPMTKSEVRAVCLSKLRLDSESICWDVGAGTGSVSAEMALQARNGTVYAVEQNKDAIEMIRKNMDRFGLENVTVVPGTAPQACRDLPAPTHVFIGGSSGSLTEVIDLAHSKNPNVCIVVSAVTLETISKMTGYLQKNPGIESEIVSLTVAKGKSAGPYHLMTGQNPVYIFTLR